jgi:hypothetical protein
VGCSEALLARCWDALSGLGVMVRDCEPALAATLAAARQPLAILVSTEVYAADPEELQALARDVRATLLPVDEAANESDLALALVSTVRAASRRRGGRSSSGRYSLLPSEPVSSPPTHLGLTHSEPPTSHTRATSLLFDDADGEPPVALR